MPPLFILHIQIIGERSYFKNDKAIEVYMVLEAPKWQENALF